MADLAKKAAARLHKKRQIDALDQTRCFNEQLVAAKKVQQKKEEDEERQ